MGKRVFHHVGLKLLSLGLAVLVWFFVTSRERSEVTFSVPVRLKTMPQGMEVSWQSNRYVNVRVRGSPLEMKGLTPQKVEVHLDLAGAQIGENVFFVSAQNVNLPEGLEAADITPSHVALRMEESLTRQLPVRPSLSGDVGEGYRLKKVEISPSTVEVRGASSVLEAVDHVETYPIDVSGIKEETVRVVFLRPPEKPIRLLQQRPYYARILVEGPSGPEAIGPAQPGPMMSNDANEDPP